MYCGVSMEIYSRENTRDYVVYLKELDIRFSGAWTIEEAYIAGCGAIDHYNSYLEGIRS